MEDNMGFRNTTVMVNQHRRDEGRGPVGRNAVMNAFDRMNPILTHTEKMCQGDNKNDSWRLAQKNQAKQNLIMRGLITREQLLTEYDGDIPPFFDPRKLPTITREQVAFFDETHIEQEAGVISKTGIQIRFPRDEHGKYAPKHPHPTYAEKMNKPSFKYAAQCRICIGVAAVMLENGETEGRKSKVYSYTGKRLVSLTERNNLRKKKYNTYKT